MYTKNDYKQKIADNISKYPAIAALYEVGDPRILQHIDAMATMLAMQSAQIEVAQNEPFQKTRDSTVLADSAMRGIVPKGSPTRAKVKAVNSSSKTITIETGRNIIDSKGRTWRVATPVSVAAGESGTFEAVQKTISVLEHTVSVSEPFYAIELPSTEGDAYLSAVSVKDSDGEYEYRDRYVNTFPYEKVFHIEADDRQRIYARFGYDDVVGFQPEEGSVITLTLEYTEGEIELEADSPFSFEYILDPAESGVELSAVSVLTPGQNPIAMSVLRDLSRYPSIYDNNAVFLGEFDFIIRKNFPTLQFLSVWNECLEEEVRGSNLSNINCLFIACLSKAGGEKVVVRASDGTFTSQEIAKAQWTGVQKEIAAAVKGCDDSYRVRFFAPVRSPMKITITATVSTTYVASEIEEKIREALVNEYGPDSAYSRRGQTKILYRKIYSLLKEKVPALTDGEADLQVSISDYSTENSYPEEWRYVDDSSITVTVSTANITTPNWR